MSRSSALTAFVLSLLPLARASAQAPHVVAPAAPLASTAEIGGENVSPELDAIRARTGVPGMVGMALQDGEVLVWGAAGVRALGSDAKVTIQDPFHLGSCTKAMTSTLVATFVEEGLLDWDTKIFDVLPELKATSDPGFAAATIDHLVRHQAGIAERQRPEVMAIFERFGELTGTLSEQRIQVARMALGTPPHTAPGTTMDYSNYGYMTAAAMLERLTGRAWEELIVERVLVPLGMESAGIGSPSGDGVPVGHVDEDDALTALRTGPGGVLPECMGPAGLLHSNLLDWSRFVSAHLAGARGEDGVVDAATFDRLQSDPIANTYACGWLVGSRNWGWGEGATLSHNGSDGTWYSEVLAIPEWDFMVLSAVNCAGTRGPQAVAQAQEHLMQAAGFAE